MDVILPSKKEQQNNTHSKLKHREDDALSCYRKSFNSSTHIYRPVER